MRRLGFVSRCSLSFNRLAALAVILTEAVVQAEGRISRGVSKRLIRSPPDPSTG